MEIDQETETLMIEGKKKDQNDRFASQSTFRISRTLPEKTKLSSVSASVQDGVWLISVQSEKKETKSRTISVPIS
jgi:HSP20 family molecular chaperone IbpA